MRHRIFRLHPEPGGTPRITAPKHRRSCTKVLTSLACNQAYRLVTQVLFVGTRIVGRSFAAAYKQAQASSEYARAQAKNGNGGGVAAKASGAGGMTLDEACKILNVDAPKEGANNAGEVMERFKRLFDANDPKKGGSFYLQSKILRARERLESEIGPLVEKEEAEAEVKEGFKPKIYKDR
ncbi:Mitochondrial import inner membrane translocase subunit tim16 [Colletotrichum siamense]|nr:Mitochondrial import inner membrane translocase subunit tim16 [Colletotrichum siamense]KAF4871375.1 Mitochondrial import inner membrane translocase subunit tim16 [Colletotrichum siamense]